jgi:hypothetical protein
MANANQILSTCKTLSFIGALALASAAHAENASSVEATSKASLQDAKSAAGATNKVPGAQEVDDLITNANLRALSGSTSRWSIASQFTFDGGTVAAPFAESRPNIANASATSTDTDINGQINVKYNIDKVNSILVGGGIRKMAPFVSSGPTSGFYAQGGKDMDFFDPSLTYQYIYRAAIVQAVLQITVTDFTRQDISSSQGQNLAQNLNFDQENIIDIGDTGLSLGGSIGFAFNRPTDSTLDYSKSQYWFAPYAEYKINETMNLRTVSNLASYEFYPISGFVQDAPTQSVGVGFSITRDIFLYPNVQFLPQNARLEATNVGTTATINLF